MYFMVYKIFDITLLPIKNLDGKPFSVFLFEQRKKLLYNVKHYFSFSF